MLIPLGTDRPSKRPTLVTPLLIAINVAVYAAQMMSQARDPEAYKALIRPYLLQPRDFHWFQPLTSAFMHADLWHLLGNMLFLWVFGQNIEDRFGRWWYLLFYLGGAFAAAGLHVAFEYSPALGASGAVAALTGAYFVLFPRTQIRVLFMLGMAIYWVSAWWVIGLAIMWDIIGQAVGGDGIAHLAHLGGVMYGALVSFILLWLKLLPREMYDLFSMTRQASRRRQLRELSRKQTVEVEKHWQRAKRGETTVNGVDSEALAHDRAAVGSLIGSGDLAGAAKAYKSLVEKYAAIPRATTLSQRNQEALATHLYVERDHTAAAYALERLIEAYPHESTTPRYQLLLARLCARELNDPVRAKALLNTALERLHDDNEIAMAKRELADLG